MGLIKYSLAFVFAAIFTVAIVTFAINFADNNNAAVSLGDDNDFIAFRDSATSNLSEYYEEGSQSIEAFSNSSLSTGDFATRTGSQFKVTQGSTRGLSLSFLNLGFKKIFGSDKAFGWILTTIITTLLFILAAYGYKAWIGRDPD